MKVMKDDQHVNLIGLFLCRYVTSVPGRLVRNILGDWEGLGIWYVLLHSRYIDDSLTLDWSQIVYCGLLW